MKKWYCCLCGKECTGPGYDPWPVVDADRYTGDCCEECNYTVVVPKRNEFMKIMAKKGIKVSGYGI